MDNMKPMTIAVDFDGTCVTHEYPNIGKDIGAAEVLIELVKNGNKIILWTMRSGDELNDAVNWFKKNKIPLYGVNKNPTQHEWTSSPKCHADLYIDDLSYNAPLLYNKQVSSRPYIDWNVIRYDLL